MPLEIPHRSFPWHDPAWQQAGLGTAVPQSLLVSGAVGAGLREFGWAIALRALCAQPDPTGFACGVCKECEWSIGMRHPDLMVLGADAPEPDEDTAASDAPKEERAGEKVKISVDDVRRLIGFMQVTPNRERARVAMLHPADAMNLAASNALLKLLEEPSARSHLILVARSPSRLPATIRSRCSQIRLPSPSREQAVAWAREEGIEQPDLALAQTGHAPLAARDLPAAYWQSRERLLPKLAGAAGARGNRSAWLDGAETHELPHVVQLLQTWCVDMAGSRWREPVRYHPDYRKDIVRCGARVDSMALHAYMDCLKTSRRRLDHPMNPKLAVEELLLGYFSMFDRG